MDGKVGLLDGMDRDHVGVIHRRQCLGFATQPLYARTVRHRIRQHLDGHLSHQPRVLPKVDLGHASAPESRDHAMVAEPHADFDHRQPDLAASSSATARSTSSGEL